MKTPHTHITNKLRTVIATIATFAMMLQAKAADTGMPWESGLNKLKDSLTGPVAGVVSVVAIVACGLGLAFAGDSMAGWVKKAITVIIAIAFIMGASSLVTLLWGSQGAMIGAMVR